MKPKLLAQILTIFVLSVTTIIRTPQNSYAESTTFFCGTYNNMLATMAKTSQGDIPLFIWNYEYFIEGGYTPNRRCLDTSRRFQAYYNNGTLNYIFAERQESQWVVCVARQQGGSCFKELFTLPPDSIAASHDLQWILGIGNQSDVVSEVESNIYININNYLNKKLLNTGGSSVGVFEEPTAPPDLPDGRRRGTGSR